MNDKDIDKLAEAIVNLMMAKQKEYDEVFLEDIKILVDKEPDIEMVVNDDKAKVSIKIKFLEEELNDMINEQDFLSAARIQKKINALKHKYNL